MFQQSSSHLHPEGGHAATAAGAGTSDSSSDSIDSDDDDGSSFGGSQRTPSLSLSTASGQALRRKLAEKSLDESATTTATTQPPVHQPLSQQITLSSSSVCSESDNDSQLRSPRRPVELVDATAGYEPIRKEEEQAAEQPECKKELPEEEVQEQTEQAGQMPNKAQTPRRTAAEEDEDAKAANEIAEQVIYLEQKMLNDKDLSEILTLLV